MLLASAARWTRHWPSPEPWTQPARITSGALIATVALLVHFAYGASMLHGQIGIVMTAEAFPFFQALTFRHLAEDLGFGVRDQVRWGVPKDLSRITYPAAPLDLQPPKHPLNLVWLTAESFRADALDPEITPALWKFAGEHARFSNHYSGGNGTRMGMFSMFYGIHGAYWFSFLKERQGPVLVDALLRQDYQMKLFTSATFSYPEFDSTVFASVPKNRLVEDDEGHGWERDRRNVGRMLDFMEQRDPARPFFTFLFFESSHAPYNFPPESTIRSPYLEDLDCVAMKLEKDLVGIRNRYWNSCHHLDSQLGRVIDYLKENELLDSTVVVITGDHGEEFLENGHWGHNSTFSEEQVRVPLVVAIPGRRPTEIHQVTSHVDICATLLPLFGVANTLRDVCLGQDLFANDDHPFIAISDWSRIALRDDGDKIVLPLSAPGLQRIEVSTAEDDSVEDPDDVVTGHREELQGLFRELTRFRR